MPRLAELLREVPHRLIAGPADTMIREVVYDSRRARPGSLFVAIPGRKEDGAGYVADALARGASAVVAERDGIAVPGGAALAIVPDARKALALMAAARWSHPSRRMGLVGVTGTDGKTTTATVIEQILSAAALPSGLLTTVELRVCGQRLPSGSALTTPAAPEVQRALARMARAGARWAVLEVSSHALALERVTGCAFDVAVMTNVTPEHLDFHGSFDEYRRAKARLFEMLGQPTGKELPRFGVVNADDPSAELFRAACPVEVISYGIDRSADVRATRVRLGPDGARFVVESPLGRHELETRFLGQFNVSNWLAAIALALGRGLSWTAIERAAELAEPPLGRAERIELGQPFGVWVDFAHTPRGLESVLRAARSAARGRVVVVFGAAGERFRANRPRLGAVARTLADVAIVTTDDPYGEDPTAILGEVARGTRVGSGSARVFVLPDRRQAIEAALRLARPGDVVVIAGRGHERYQTFGTRRVRFEDARVARELLRGIYGQPRERRLAQAG
ncbi:MAG TPA: UDP-N-acetylmuramoyl-L-alanyl-D-glutamate--2,6-diaminopimelate ligase [Chloroflexota bacterium]